MGKWLRYEGRNYLQIQYASETWKSERSYTPFSARLAFLREFDPLRWYQLRMLTANLLH
jgi:hypothetical protein